MRRVSLSVVVLLLSVAGAAFADGLPGQGAHARASIRQDAPCDPASSPGDADCDGVQDSEDKCPSQYGTGVGRANGCPDADGDGTVDAEDQCPTVSGDGIDGCQTFHVGFNAYLPNTWFYSDGGGKVTGVAVVKLTRAAAHKLGLSSTRLGSFDFVHPCGEGTICAKMALGAAVKRKIKRAEGNHSEPVYVEGSVTFEMTSPRTETITRAVRWGLGTNGGQYRVCGAGYPPAQYKSPNCGGKSTGEDG